ncbi:hypothetical protein AALP_AA7G052800 [Arabis alpina]|uniref:DUF3444 domain-containing protein n=1 Tax=Arabis alpina TaxID=50452 RepID=A0A087GG13_ARAAL|nr:hypothetical protein AALP_AA7G052800 [Arabis alpina]
MSSGKKQLRKAAHLSTSTYISYVLSEPKTQDVKGRGLAQPPLRITGPRNQLMRASGGENKGKGPLFDVNQLITASEGLKIKAGKPVLTGIMLRNALVEKAKSMIKLSLERTEASFGENQVWAAYDTDGMPRIYALVQSVISQEPFKLCVSWLTSNNNEELGPMKWIGSGFCKTSGRFLIGRCIIDESLNSFSHKIQWTKGSKGFVYIYPKKGDVWALYTNWSPSWDFSTPEEVVNKYEMVEVLQDFDEERGVTVAALVKVPGFQTVFHRHQNPKTFPTKELFRFSHQVASHLLTGQEGVNAPQGCLELDPAAMSPELLKVFTEEEIRELEDKGKKPKEEIVDEAIKNLEINVFEKSKDEADDVVETRNNGAMDDEA